MNKCEACNGTGWALVSIDEAEPPEGMVFVQRCDSCKKYSSDYAAATAYCNTKNKSMLAVVCRAEGYF